MKRQQRPLESAQRGFTLVELLVVIAIIGVLVALLLPAIQAAREAARRAQCQSNIKNVSLAVISYESDKKITPMGMQFSQELYQDTLGQLQMFKQNWIIDVLPYMEEQPLYDSFNLARPINDPMSNLALNKNYHARGATIPVLLCPSDPNNLIPYQGKTGTLHGKNWARTNYAGNSGGAYLLKGCTPADLCSYGPDSEGWKSNKRRGIMGPNTSVPLKRVVDGTSKTILVGEIRTGLSDKDARGVWAMGHAAASLLAMYGSQGDANGPNACYTYADDAYSDVCGTADAIDQCMDCYDGNHFAQATVRSVHPGGAHVAMTDGSVTFIADDVETSGNFGSWGSLWDRLIASADEGMPGDFNGSYP